MGSRLTHAHNASEGSKLKGEGELQTLPLSRRSKECDQILEIIKGDIKDEKESNLGSGAHSFHNLRELESSLDPVTSWIYPPSSLLNDIKHCDGVTKDPLVESAVSQAERITDLVESPSACQFADSLFRSLEFSDGLPPFLRTEPSRNEEESGDSGLSLLENSIKIRDAPSPLFDSGRTFDANSLPFADTLLCDHRKNVVNADILPATGLGHVNQGDNSMSYQTIGMSLCMSHKVSTLRPADNLGDHAETFPFPPGIGTSSLDIAGATNMSAAVEQQHEEEFSRRMLAACMEAKARYSSGNTIVDAVKRMESPNQTENVREEPVSKRIEEFLQRKPQKRKQAKFLKPVPSRFCHICARTPKTARNVVCAKLRTGHCRKVVCERCFNCYGWDWKDANSPNSDWICPHCTGKCPQRAQCHTYSKTNNRLRVKRIITKRKSHQSSAASLILPARAKKLSDRLQPMDHAQSSDA